MSNSGTVDILKKMRDDSLKIDSKKNRLDSYISNHKINTLLDIDPENIINWKFHDRPSNELGDIDSLAKEFISIGQQQPCIVRKNDNNYELIIGERRWRAAKKAGIKLKVIIKEFSDSDAALAQAAENDNRIDLSDYAKGMSYSRLIKDKVIKQKDLVERLGRSKQYVSSLLSFSKIDSCVIESISDWSKVSSYTAEAIVRLTKHNPNNIAKIIGIGHKIQSGVIGHRNLEKHINNTYDKKDINKKILTANGRHVFTWRTDNNNLPSIHFPKQFANLFDKKTIDFNDFSSDILKLIENKLNEI